MIGDRFCFYLKINCEVNALLVDLWSGFLLFLKKKTTYLQKFCIWLECLYEKFKVCSSAFELIKEGVVDRNVKEVKC